ncbi:MAG: redoxin domain-containing protein [Planctomycetota bacterium]
MSRRSLVILVLGLGAALPVSADTQPGPDDAALANAESQADSKDSPKADSSEADSSPADPVPTDAPNARAALKDGTQLQKQGKYDEAIAAFRRAQKFPAPVDVQAELEVEIAETYFRKGRAAKDGTLEKVSHEPLLRRAARGFTEAVKKYTDPKAAESIAYASYMVGSSHMMLGETQKAFDAYKQTYFKHRENKYGKRALLRLGVCLGGMDTPKKAIQIFQTFLQHYSKDPDVKRDVSKVSKYIAEHKLAGLPAPPVNANKWMNQRVQKGLEDLREEVVVLCFFATWCKVCAREVPQIKREIKRWGDRGVVFIGVTNPADTRVTEPVDFYCRRSGLNFFDVALDNGARSWSRYRVTGLPAMVVIDRKGVTRWRGHPAFLSHDLLEKLLKEK